VGGNHEINPLKITKWGHFKDSSTFLAPKWPSLMLMPFKRPKKSRASQKVSGLSKSLDFVPGPFKILEMAPFCDFQGLIS
jgi:hypothetical protein